MAVRHVDGHVHEPQVILAPVFRRSAALLGQQDSPSLVEFCFAEEDAGDFERPAVVVAEPAVAELVVAELLVPAVAPVVAPAVGLPAGLVAVVEEP